MLEQTAKELAYQSARRKELGAPLVDKYVRLATEADAFVMAKRITAKMECYDFGQAVEPGYDENTVRVYANWNNYPKQLKAIEKLNALGCPIEAEWEDEWASCDECGRYVRTSPDSYGWTRSYAEMDSELVCHECVKADPDEYIEWLTNHPKHANTILDDSVLEAAGFRQFANDLENGLHEFQAASPTKIARWLREHGVNEYLFSIDDQGQFDTTFSVWIRGETQLELPANASEWNDSPSPAEVMKAMLRQI